jgi:hypothetical protein
MLSPWIVLFLGSFRKFMRQLLLVILILAGISGLQAQEVLEFKQTSHDFGKIPQGKPAYHYFEIVNLGKEPVKLDNVTATCGCTTPEWSQDPIGPGQSQKIKVGYNAASDGVFEKFITITYNGNQTKQISIKGNVWKAPLGSAPSNSSIQFLKQKFQ